MKAKNGKRLFLCEITEQRLILAVLACEKNNRRRFISLDTQQLAQDSFEQGSRQLQELFRARRYAKEPVVVSVPHKYATSRFLRIPASSDVEIEKIVSLQASRLLPAASDELITGFQVISKDKDGYSRVNLIIVQKAAIDRYCALMQQSGIRDFSITLSSIGLFNLCETHMARTPGITALIEIDGPQAEICFCSKEALMFSRSFILPENWKQGLADEYRKTEESFLKENPGNSPAAILLAGPPSLYPQLAELKAFSPAIRQEPLRYWENIVADESFLSAMKTAVISPASLIGTGLKDIPPSMDFLPPELKKAKKSKGVRSELVTAGTFLLASCLIVGAAFNKQLADRQMVMQKLSAELSLIEKEARRIELIEKKYSGLALAGNSCLQFLTETHRVIPTGISLSGFIYEGPKQLTLR